MSDKTICNKCGVALVIGDYPFCPHGSIYNKDAQTASATVVFRNKEGEHRFPGRDTDRPPRGFERIELRTQRQRDAFEREVGKKETARLRDIEYSRREAYKQTFAMHKDRLIEIKNRSQSPHTKRFVDLCLQDAERRMEANVTKAESGFMIESNHIDASNRMAWMDKDTGWKPRK